MTVQPRERRVSIAGCPVPTEGAEPPDCPNSLVPVAIPEVTRETKIPSMLASFRLVSSKQALNLLSFTLSKALAGNIVREGQLRQVLVKSAPFEKSSKGKLIRDVQLSHADLNSIPLEVSITGKLIIEAQSHHAKRKSVPLEVSISGKLVNDLQPYHATLKLVPLDVSINGKSVNELQFNHAR